MSDKPKYPALKRIGQGKWGTRSLGHVPLPCDPPRGSDDERKHNNIAMCDYGAKQFYAGKCDCIAIDCMPGEVEEIRAYMKSKHPTVNFVFGSASYVLENAQADWRKKFGRPTESDIQRNYY